MDFPFGQPGSLVSALGWPEGWEGYVGKVGNLSKEDFEDSIVFPKPGDIFNFRGIDQEEFDQVREQVEDGSFEYRKKEFVFHPDRSLADPHTYNEEILGVLYGD